MRLRIAVTSTTDRFPRWAAPLRSHGFAPVSLPCIEIRPAPGLEEARTTAASADWLMFTSPRAVELLWPEGGMPAVPVASVGEATAAAVRTAGGLDSLTGGDDGDGLVDLLVGERPGRVVAPHGDRADPVRFSRLQQIGVEVTAIPVYHTVPVPPGGDPVDGAVFASPSAVEGWVLARPLHSLRVVGAIGPVTADALRHQGVEAPVVAHPPAPRYLAAAMSDNLEKSP